LSGRELEVPRPRCALAEDEVERLVQLAYLRFYYRPSYVARALGRVRSWEEFARSARTAAQMLVRSPGARVPPADG